jgi:hypothetical protein
MGLKHLRAEIKMAYSNNVDAREKMERKTIFYKQIGWLTEDKEVLKSINGGQEDFNKKIAERILKEHKAEIDLNNCPNCRRLARTPFARQCRYCEHTWR